jgi:ADP-heptose:LPS heptosyltransferase
LVEGLADRFEPRLCDVYAQLFSEVVALAQPGTEPAGLKARYERIRKTAAFSGDAAAVRQIFVLSRVTLGADIAVTSPILDGLKRAFPNSEIYLVGGSKSHELFASDHRIRPCVLPYSRTGLLRDRLAVWPQLCALVDRPCSIVVDPDSRLTQLGLLPVCPEQRYFFFESRAFGGDSTEPLARLAGRWVEQSFGVSGVPYVALPEIAGALNSPPISVSLGVGKNPAKRLPDPFEAKLLRGLADRADVVVDKGGDTEEAQRVESAIASSASSAVRAFEGSFATFAALVARSRLFVGYDSAAGHAAAACGTPAIIVFAGAVSPRMRQRWHPWGRGPVEVVEADGRAPEAVVDEVLRHADRLLGLPVAG